MKNTMKISPSTHHAMNQRFGHCSARINWVHALHAQMLDHGAWMTLGKIVDKYGFPAGGSISAAGSVMAAGHKNGWFQKRIIGRPALNTHAEEIAYRACVKPGNLDLPENSETWFRPGMVRVSSVFDLAIEVLR